MIRVEREIARYYRHPGRGWRARNRGLLISRIAPVPRFVAPYYVPDDIVYADAYDYGYEPAYVAAPYRRPYIPNNGFVFSIGSRSGNFYLSFGSFDRNPYIDIPYTPYDRYSYVAYPYPVPAPVDSGYAPAYRRSQTFNVEIAGTPISYTRYEESAYGPPYSSYGYYGPVYADNASYYDPWFEGGRYAIDPYGSFCHPATNYRYSTYESPVYYNRTAYDEVVFVDRGWREGSFYDRHRNIMNIGLAGGAGAAIGAILGGKRGALIGAGIGAGAGAVYTYGINPKDKFERGI